MKSKSEYLVKIFECLNNMNVRYCVMSKYYELPNVINGDIDIAVSEKDYLRLDRVVERIANSENILVVQKIWHGYKKCAYLLTPEKISEPFYFQLDFFTDFSVNGLPNLLPGQIMFSGVNKYKGFKVPSFEVEMLFLIMRRIAKNDWESTHIERLQNLADKLSEKGSQKILEVFGSEAGAVLINSIKSGDIYNLKYNYVILRKSLKRISFENTNICYRFKYLSHQFRRQINRIHYPVGMSIAFLGPDGSGKSSVSAEVQDLVSGAFFGAETLYWRPTLLPLMGELGRNAKFVKNKVNKDPHGRAKNGFVKSIVRFFYYVIDYIFGYFPKLYCPAIRKKIVLIDRYYCDYLVDLHRYGFNLPIWLPKVIFPLIPLPDILVYLDADPENILKRKQELTNSELQRQISEFRGLSLKIPKMYVVDNNRPIDEVVQEIATLIFKFKAQRTSKIMKCN